MLLLLFSKGVRFFLCFLKGSNGLRCIVIVNYFYVELFDKDLYYYDVSFFLFLKVFVIIFIGLFGVGNIFLFIVYFFYLIL